MEIIPYRELESKDGLLPLLDHAFKWVFNQSMSDGFVKIDPRLRNGPVGFCGVEDGRIIGHVGVMDLATRTLDRSIEYAGGLYGVATLPGYTRKGVCTTLMNKAHEYFRNKRYRFSFLSTGQALVAHALYEKLGYGDLIEYPSVYKVFHNKKAEHYPKENIVAFDPEKILAIYNEFSKEKTGFVVRDRAYIKMLKKTEGIRPKQCIVDEQGYVIFREDKTGIWIRELIALNAEQMHKLVGILENRTRGAVYDRAVLDARLLEVYRSRGYMIQNRSWGVMMFKPLTSGASFKKTYGDRFYLSRLDAF
ncbi:MAG: GNAT family N-acetyltransferase [Candidatus Bathyarchaeia archaeon]|jgi:GNAT superfamily N-acetyltransferase